MAKHEKMIIPESKIVKYFLNFSSIYIFNKHYIIYAIK